MEMWGKLANGEIWMLFREILPEKSLFNSVIKFFVIESSLKYKIVVSTENSNTGIATTPKAIFFISGFNTEFYYEKWDAKLLQKEMRRCAEVLIFMLNGGG